MKWNRKGDLVLGYGGIFLGLLAAGFFFKIAMIMEDPTIIFISVLLGCLFSIEIMVSCMLTIGVYEREWKK